MGTRTTQPTKLPFALLLFLSMILIIPALAAQAGLNREQNELDVIQAGPDFEKVYGRGIRESK